MAKQSALDKAIANLEMQAEPLQHQLDAIMAAIGALSRQKIADKVAKPARTRKPKEPAALAAEVKA